MSVPLPAAPDPARLAVAADVSSVRMLAATDDGQYGVAGYEHPVVLCWVDVSGGRLGMRLDVTGYPGQAPAGQPWDLVSDTALPVGCWPVGGRAGLVLRPDWSPANNNAPYLACDRNALVGHDSWRHGLGGRAWTSAKTVADYLDQVRAALHGSRLPSGVTT